MSPEKLTGFRVFETVPRESVKVIFKPCRVILHFARLILETLRKNPLKQAQS